MQLNNFLQGTHSIRVKKLNFSYKLEWNTLYCTTTQYKTVIGTEKVIQVGGLIAKERSLLLLRCYAFLFSQE